MKINGILLCALCVFSLNAQTISFTASDLAGESLVHPTVIQFGPDGRLYMAQQDGKIFAYTVVRNSANNYQITATETITLIQQIPNHNENGLVNAAVNTRQVTGFIVVGTAASPVIYASSSDPRIGGGTSGPANDKNLDTNSGVLSKLARNGNSWTRTDLVRGLPRSEENHSTNGMQLDAANNILYLCQGGNTNMGAPSNNFVYLPEYAYSGAILSVDLDVIGNSTYDLPTLDDEDKPNTSATPGYTENTDPFGGNSGKNQAKLDQLGPVQIYSAGWRNHYDLVITKAGRMYSFDNGPNYGWGGMPTNCLNSNADPGSIYCDVLQYVPGPGYYAGHPNPTRGNRSNTFNTTNPQTPIPPGMENPAECTYISAGNESGSMTTICSSTNGMCEYTASNFSNAMKGDLMAAAFNGKIYRFELNATGDELVSGGQTVFATGFGSTPLDVTAQGDNDIFPGTVWAITYESGNITVFEPSDYSEPNPALIAYNSADVVNGGRMYNTWWADETDFISPVDPVVNMSNVINFSEFYRCKSCHAWDQKGKWASYIDRPQLVNRPKVTGINLHDSVPAMTITELFDKVKHIGGAAVDPVRTADGTNSTLGGNRMPDFSKLLTDKQVWDIVKFLREGAFDTGQLYDIATTGTYPTGTKAFSNIGKDGNGAAGLLFFNTNCKSCHGANGRDGSLSNGLGGYINYDIGMSIGEFARKKPYEIQHKAVHGELGTVMHGVNNATIEDIKNLLKTLSDPVAFPDLHPVWYADNDNDGYGNPNDTSIALIIPPGFVANNKDCDDTRASVNPGEMEIRDNLDNDCDGAIDEGIWSININAGGPQYISLAGDTFLADSYYTIPSSIYISTVADILGTSDDALYKTERFGNFSYNIPVPSIGTYEVRLHFAEVWNNGQYVGARKFHVDAESSRFLSNYDIFAKVGGYTATTETFAVMVDDGMLNIAFSSVINNAKVNALTIVRISDLVEVFNNADAVNGGRMYDRFWADETNFISPVDAAIDMNNIISFSDFYRCRSCHGWDQKGKMGAYIDRPANVTRPNVANGLLPFMHSSSIVELFAAIKNKGGAAVNPARTADGTNASLGGNLHPDYGKILTDEQIWDIVKFLKEKAFDTDQLYDLNITGVYPTGAKAFTNLGKNGDVVAGALFYSNNCASCHGSNGRDGSYFAGVAIGELARTKPYEVQHKAVYGNLGTSMYGVSDATIEDIKNMLKALSDPAAYPNLNLAFFRDVDGDGYGNPIDSLVSSGLPDGYVRNKSDCDDTRSNVNPFASEIYDLLDNNCNGQVDEGFGTLNTVRINAGGPQYISSEGNTFIADSYYLPSALTYTNNGIADILNTNDDVLYKTERYGLSLGYAIPMSNGSYNVGLHFAEIYFNATGGPAGGIGSRVFDVSIEGIMRLDNYDIYADAGTMTAVVKQFTVNITDGMLNIDLASVVNNAKISAISVTPAANVDCNGVINGTAFIDGCGVCSGGNTGHVANSSKDACGVCFGNGSSCLPACTHLEVVSFTLMHEGTAGEIGPLTNGTVINLSTIGSFSVRANVCDLPVGSVKFVLNGSTVKTENTAPYAIKGDSPAGNYIAWKPAIGSYTLNAIPYSQANATGTAGISETVSFTVINQATTTDCNGVPNGISHLNSCGICVGGNTGLGENQGKDCNGVCNGTAAIDDCGICAGGNTGKIPNASKDCHGVCFGNAVIDNCGVCGGNGSTCSCLPLNIASLTLVHAGTIGDIGPLTNGLVINKSQTGPFSIRADVCPGSTIQSVQFKLNGTVFRTENLAPYSLNGDKPGNYYAWNASVGAYTLTVTGYSGKAASGTAGSPLTVTFEVVAYSYKVDEQNLTESSSPDINIFPNPNSGNFTIQMNVQARTSLSLEIFSQLGQSVYNYSNGDYLGEFNYNVSLENQPGGIYMMKIRIGDDWYVKRIAVTQQ